MVTVPPGHWITLPAASQEKPGVEIRFVAAFTVSHTTGPLPFVTFCDSRLPNPSYVQLRPHCGPVVAAAISRPIWLYWSRAGPRRFQFFGCVQRRDRSRRSP